MPVPWRGAFGGKHHCLTCGQGVGRHRQVPPQSIHAEPRMAGRALHHAGSTGDVLLIKDSQSVKGIFGNLNVDTTVVKLALCVWLPRSMQYLSVPDPVCLLGPGHWWSPCPPSTSSISSSMSSCQPESRESLPSPPLLITLHSLIVRVLIPIPQTCLSPPHSRCVNLRVCS